MSVFSQMFPPRPEFTEKNAGDLAGKTYIVTGASAGVGLELTKILYSRSATVYMGARSFARFEQGAQAVQEEIKESGGSLKPFIVDLSDLKTVRPAVTTFLDHERKLDVLFLNAGVMTPPAGSKTVDGYDLELGTNCLSSVLLVRLLTPTLTATASLPTTPASSIRVVWVSSCLDIGTPKGGVQLNEHGAPKQLKGMANYMQSKAGLYLLSHHFARCEQSGGKEKGEQIIHVSLNPGFMKTELQRHMPPPARLIMGRVFKGPKYGAYTELYAGLADGVENGGFYIPWGRKGVVPGHVLDGGRSVDGKKSVGEAFWEWCERETNKFV